VLDPPPGLRPGMTAEVQILAEQIADAVQVPVQAVLERGGKHFCLVLAGEKLVSREVLLGSTNDKVVVIRDGLRENELVAVNPRTFVSQVDLPQITAEEPESDLAAQFAKAKAARGTTGAADAAESQGDKQTVKKRPASKGSSMGAADPSAMAGMMIERMDKDGDGKVSADEMPQQRRAGFSKSDTNGDGFLDKTEIAAAMSRARSGGASGGPSRGGSSPNAAPAAGASE